MIDIIGKSTKSVFLKDTQLPDLATPAPNRTPGLDFVVIVATAKPTPPSVTYTQTASISHSTASPG